MLYEDLNELPPSKFKRTYGVDCPTFAAIVNVLRPHLERIGQRGGQNTLPVEDQLLLTL